jgi:dGTPase
MDWSKLLNPNRKRQSTMPKDHRAQFERDYDRAIFSTPVKRLQDKTQVFPLDPNDAVRTRLTHSLEVSTVARGLATAVCPFLMKKEVIAAGDDRNVEAIAEACGLIHDLGNPPFGHCGEKAIRSWFAKIDPDELRKQLNGDEQRVQDLLQFEGNAQTLRLVAKLQILADFNGLNLTFGTLSAARKYIARSNEANADHEDHAKRKPGFFASENELIQRIEHETGVIGVRNPLTFLVEAADDIVYLVADIEDGIKKGIITWEEIQKELLNKQVDPEGVKAILDLKDTILKAGRAAVPEGLPQDTHGSAFRTAAIAVLVQDARDTFIAHFSEIDDGTYKRDLVGGGKRANLVELLKNIGLTRIYCTTSTLKLEVMGRRIIDDLMTMFWEGAKWIPVSGKYKTKEFPGKIARLLSQNYKDVFVNSCATDPDAPEMYHRYQLVTDYVCGMTDTFAQRLHSELSNG